MSKILIWPDIYKEQGHWLPCVNLANTLTAAGHSVRFMGIPDCASIISPYVAPANFANFFTQILADIYPPGYTLENKLEPLDQRWKPAHLLPIAGNPATGKLGSLDAVFTSPNKPDLLIGGYFTGLETLMLHHKYGVRIALITTYLRHPADDPAIHAKTKLVYMPRALSQSLIDRVVPQDKLGMDIDTFIKPLEQANELIPCPREFDFFDDDWVIGAKTNYVEPMIVRSSLDGSGSKPGNPSGVPTDKKLIYGTSGSQVQDYEGQARAFFLSLIDMMKTQGLDDYHLVLAVGDKLFAQFQIEFGVDVNPINSALPSNVHLFPWVSQLDVMAHASVAYMHGGLATIKESIWNQVPIVIVPHGKDQHDNATRIRRNGVGVVSEVANLSAEDLRKLFTQATASTWIRNNLQKMQGLFSARELANPSHAVIQDSLTQPL
jgi:hypothetical protein